MLFFSVGWGASPSPSEKLEKKIFTSLPMPHPFSFSLCQELTVMYYSDTHDTSTIDSTNS